MCNRKIYSVMILVCMSLFVALPYVSAEDTQNPPVEAVKTVGQGSADATGTTVAASADAAGKTVEASANAAGTTVESAAGAVATTVGAVTGQETGSNVKSENAAKQNQIEEAAKTAKAKAKGNNFTSKNKHKK
jgi:hypothetical protein